MIRNFLRREEEVEDVPIDLKKDETGDDRLLVMYTVGSKKMIVDGRGSGS